MRFLRWYWRITTALFRKRELSKGVKGFFVDFKYSLFAYIKAVFINVALFMLVIFLWFSLPAPMRESVVSIVQPFFDWVSGLNWEGAFLKFDSFMQGLTIIISHFLIALFTTVFTMSIILSVVDFFRIVVFNQEWKKEKRAISIVCLIISALGGYYATTSKYGVSAVNYVSSSFLFDHNHHKDPAK
ncbi:MAG: hypothetical protein Q8Q89_00635 [bacterium]|nr:hypothetical protein [bacterium]